MWINGPRCVPGHLRPMVPLRMRSALAMRLHSYRDESHSRHFDLIGGGGHPWSIDLVYVTASGHLSGGLRLCAHGPLGPLGFIAARQHEPARFGRRATRAPRLVPPATFRWNYAPLSRKGKGGEALVLPRALTAPHVCLCRPVFETVSDLRDRCGGRWWMQVASTALDAWPTSGAQGTTDKEPSAGTAGPNAAASGAW